jgi:hypothetical protein
MHRLVSTDRARGARLLVLALLVLPPAAALAQDAPASASAEPAADAPTTAPAEAAATAPVDTAPADQAARVEVAPEPAAPEPVASPADAPSVVKREIRIEVREERAAPGLDGVQLATVAFLAGAVCSVVAVPAALVAGSVLGSLPQNLILAALPPLLVAGLLPPLAVAGGEWLLQDWLVDDPGSFWIAWGSTTLVHVGALIGGGLLGVSTTELPALATLVAAEGLLLPLTATTALTLTRAEDGDDD